MPPGVYLMSTAVVYCLELSSLSVRSALNRYLFVRLFVKR